MKVSKYIKEEKEKKGFAIVINDAESKTYKKYKNLSYDSKSGNLRVKK